MNGAQALVRTAALCGVDICFTNPGTTEMHLVDALDTEPGIRAVLGLFEGVVTGAADGYGRMSGKPALTLLHLGPGFANGIANLHNARRARTPLVNLIGHHTTWQRNYDPPLNSDVETLAAPVSSWQRTNATADQLGADVAEAISAASSHPGQIATLVVPADSQWNETERTVAPRPSSSNCVSAQRIEQARTLLADVAAERTVLFLGGHALREAGLRDAGRIRSACGCRLAAETFAARLERGPDLPAPDRLPYFPEQADAFFAGVEHVILAGASEPVAFFGYQQGRERMIPDGVEISVLAAATENAPDALARLAESLDAPSTFESPGRARPETPSGTLDPSGVAQAIVAAQPENAIIVDEGVTALGAYFELSKGAPRHSYLSLTGGAIGFGMPCAVGAALACPDRRVIALEGDGSCLYTAQALWTQAREGLDVVNVVFANDLYRILQIELHRAGVSQPGPQGKALTELQHPSIGWQELAKGFGVPSQRAETAEELHRALERALAEPGPQLIEARVL